MDTILHALFDTAPFFVRLISPHRLGGRLRRAVDIYGQRNASAALLGALSTISDDTR